MAVIDSATSYIAGPTKLIYNLLTGIKVNSDCSNIN
jgi:hypothetical protein